MVVIILKILKQVSKQELVHQILQNFKMFKIKIKTLILYSYRIILPQEPQLAINRIVKFKLKPILILKIYPEQILIKVKDWFSSKIWIFNNNNWCEVQAGKLEEDFQIAPAIIDNLKQHPLGLKEKEIVKIVTKKFKRS